MSRIDGLVLQLKGLVYARALRETDGAAGDELSTYNDAIARVRAELAELSGGELREAGDARLDPIAAAG
jgi:hypothetical protein